MNTEKIFKEPQTHQVLLRGTTAQLQTLVENLTQALKEDDASLQEMLTAAQEAATPINAVAPDFSRRVERARVIIETLGEICQRQVSFEDARTAVSLEMLYTGAQAYGRTREGAPTNEQAAAMIDPKVYNEILGSKLSAEMARYAQIDPATGLLEINCWRE